MKDYKALIDGCFDALCSAYPMLCLGMGIRVENKHWLGTKTIVVSIEVGERTESETSGATIMCYSGIPVASEEIDVSDLQFILHGERHFFERLEVAFENFETALNNHPRVILARSFALPESVEP